MKTPTQSCTQCITVYNEDDLPWRRMFLHPLPLLRQQWDAPSCSFFHDGRSILYQDCDLSAKIKKHKNSQTYFPACNCVTWPRSRATAIADEGGWMISESSVFQTHCELWYFFNDIRTPNKVDVYFCNKLAMILSFTSGQPPSDGSSHTRAMSTSQNLINVMVRDEMTAVSEWNHIGWEHCTCHTI